MSITIPIPPSWTFDTVQGTTDQPWVNWCASSADGSVLAACTYQAETVTPNSQYGLWVFDKAGNTLFTDLWTNCWHGAFWVAVSPDGASVAVGGWLEGSPSYTGRLRIWDVKQKTLRLDMTTSSRVEALAFSADGTYLVAGCGDTYGDAPELYVCQLQAGGTYSVVSTYTATGSCAIQWLAITSDNATILCAAQGEYTVLAFANNGAATLTPTATWTLPSGTSTPAQLEAALAPLAARGPSSAPRAASGSSGPYAHVISLSQDNAKFAISTSNIGVAMFDLPTFLSGSTSPSWSYQISGTTTSYGALMLKDDTGYFVIGTSNYPSPPGTTGGNGVVFRVDDGGTSGTLAWSWQTPHWPSPSLSPYQNTFFTNADGYPVGTEGNFFGFMTSTFSSQGPIVECTVSDNMCWPFIQSVDGTAALGGSDNGTIYCFNGNVPGGEAALEGELWFEAGKPR